MPIYEYECLQCGHRFELRRGIADSDREIRCPKCGTHEPRRILSAFATVSSFGSCVPGGSYLKHCAVIQLSHLKDMRR